MNLTNLPKVKNWLGIPSATTDDDAQLSALLTAASNFIQNWIERPDLVKTTVTELRDGSGQQSMMLRNWPVVSVLSVSVGSQSFSTPTSLGQNGYTLSTSSYSRAGAPQSIELTGNFFCRGKNNVQFVYQAGYCVQNEPQIIPATPGPYTGTPASPNGLWAQDDGVAYASGGSLTPVSGTPSSGQYSVVTDATTGVTTYTFNAADQGNAILLNYSYIPADIVQVATELVGERWRYKQRIGQKSVSQGGDVTMSFSLDDLQPWQMTALVPYRYSFPIN